MTIRMLTAIGLGLLCSNLWAATYKWTDDKGNVHYGARPPAGVKAEEVHTKKSSSTAQQEIDAFKAKQKASLEAEKKLAEEKATREQKLEQMRIWKANCHAAKNKLNALIEKPKVRKVDTFGNLSIMPEKELNKQIQEAEAEVDLYCSPPKEQNSEPDVVTQ